MAEIAADAFDADVAFTMLADDQALREVLSTAVCGAAQTPLTIVNMATISVAFAEVLAGRAAATAQNCRRPAPVMGRPDVAAAAKLNILAAGPGAAVDAVEPLSG